MILTTVYYCLPQKGYIAGTADGIVTVNGNPASRQIVVLDATTLQWLHAAKSMDNGRYLITGLNPSKKYVIMARPIPSIDGTGLTPAVFDNITPANDLSLDEQQDLWESWQT